MIRYKGVVFKIEGSPYLFTQKKDGTLTDGIGVSDHEKIYANMPDNIFSCVFVEFMDGTLPVEIEQFLDDQDWGENIFFKILDIKWITMKNDKDEEVSPQYVIDSGDLEYVLNSFFDDEEIYDDKSEDINIIDEGTIEKTKTTKKDLGDYIKKESNKKRKKKDE